MSLAIVYSRAILGMHAPLVTVEVHVTAGMVGFHLVGLPATAVKESKDRVRSTLINAQFDFPARRITVNLAPADLPKEDSRFDLAIALGVLAASQQIPLDVLAQYEFIGELALSGALRGVKGALSTALAAKQAGRKLMTPIHNQAEVALVRETPIFCASHLLEVCAHLKGERCLPMVSPCLTTETMTYRDLSDVHGQPHAKRALEIAAAGRHSVLFVGPPGTGKTMLASRLPSLLPELTEREALEVAAIYTMSHSGFDPKKWRHIPFRSPHHSASSVALVGGGRPPKPGEISLAHHGVLFLDELPEFHRHALECLREPLESEQITIVRAAFQSIFPARFQLIVAMNPCPCGYAGQIAPRCRCTTEQIKRYWYRLSGPFLNRIDMQILVAPVPLEALIQHQTPPETASAVIKKRVMTARALQLARQGKLNDALTHAEMMQQGMIQPVAKQLLHEAMKQFHFSMRVYHRLIKIARTIADLAEQAIITDAHISESLQLRYLDRLQAEGLTVT